MTDLRTAAQQALEALEYYQHRRLEWDYSDEVAITALRAALAEPPVDDPHRDHWVAIAEAAQKIAASKECGLMEAKALCAALDRLTDATLAEPVAWMVYTLDGKSVCVTDNPADFGPEHKALPLYTAPPQRKPLTEADIAKIMDYGQYAKVPEYAMNFVRAIESAHGIGGQT